MKESKPTPDTELGACWVKVNVEMLVVTCEGTGNEGKGIESKRGPRKHALVSEGQTAGERAQVHTGARKSSHSSPYFAAPLTLEQLGFEL